MTCSARRKRAKTKLIFPELPGAHTSKTGSCGAPPLFRGADYLGHPPGISSAPTLEAKAGKLQAFVNHVNAQRGNALTPAQADYLIALAQVI